MDADKNGTIDQTEWEQHMTPELRAAIEAKLQDSGIVAGFKPLVDIALVFLGLADQFDLDKLVAALDTDANGSISIEEFKAGIPKEVLQAMISKLNEKGLIEGLAA